MTAPGHTANAPATPRMPVKRRLILIAFALGMLLAPAIVMVLVTWIGTGTPQAAATWASIPAIVGVAAAMAGGRRYAVIVAIVMGFLGPLSIVAGLSPVSGAALMALMCMTVGRLSRVGLQTSGLLVPVMLSWALIDPPTWDGAATVDRLDTEYLLWMALIFLVGGLVPALFVSLLMRKRPLPTPTSHSQSEATTYTVMITVLVNGGDLLRSRQPENDRRGVPDRGDPGDGAYRHHRYLAADNLPCARHDPRLSVRGRHREPG